MDDSEMFAATFANLALIISVLSLCVAVAQLFLGLGCIEQFFYWIQSMQVDLRLM